MSTIRVDNLQTTGGAGLYPAKAWVNFNGTGTVAIRSDGNVSSITDEAEGKYTVNLSPSQSSASYSITTGSGENVDVNENAYDVRLRYNELPTTSYYKLSHGYYTTSNVYRDAHIVNSLVTL